MWLKIAHLSESVDVTTKDKQDDSLLNAGSQQLAGTLKRHGFQWTRVHKIM